MNIKKAFSVILAIVLSLSVASASAQGTLLISPAPTPSMQESVTVEYDNTKLSFDVEPIIEDGRTLVPFRAIFEVMGCAVSYAEQDDSTKVVGARRGDDHLMLTIGQNIMYFNNEPIELEVGAKIKDSRTLVPIRAITEAFDCDVSWDGDTKTVSIEPPVGHYNIRAHKIEETIKDDNGNVLIETVAYYPVIDDASGEPDIIEINEDYKWSAEKFVEEVRGAKEDAAYLLEQMGAEKYKPAVFELTYDVTYNIFGILSITTHKYMNTGGMHPTIMMESRSFNVGAAEELSVSTVLDERALDKDLIDYVVDLFVQKINTMQTEATPGEVYDFVYNNIGYVQFYLCDNSLVLYFNQGEVFPYAFGVVSVTLPYQPLQFLVDLDNSLLDEYVYEVEYNKDFEWVIINNDEDKIQVTVENEDYDPETLLSQYYPVGMTRITLKPKARGNATLCFAHVKKGDDISEATRVIIPQIFVDKNNKMNIVTELDDINLLK